jgi:hypothetical protein
MSSNATPWDERNSFAALQGPQVGLLKTRTFAERSVMLNSSSPEVVAKVATSGFSHIWPGRVRAAEKGVVQPGRYGWREGRPLEARGCWLPLRRLPLLRLGPGQGLPLGGLAQTGEVLRSRGINLLEDSEHSRA